MSKLFIVSVSGIQEGLRLAVRAWSLGLEHEGGKGWSKEGSFSLYVVSLSGLVWILLG